LADPFPVLSNFDSVILIDVGVNEACPCARLEFVDQHPQLGHVSVRLNLGFLCNPGRTLHEVSAFFSTAGKDLLTGPKPLLKLIVFLNQKATLSFHFIVCERCFNFIRHVMFPCAQASAIFT
jgi:hypothetical protein